MNKSYLEPTQAAAQHLFMRNLSGPIVMLNLLRFREWADYSDFPDVAPIRPISGRAAYQRYIDETLPFLEATGGEILFLGDGGAYFIGPETEQWDLVMMIKQNSLSDFFGFASNEAYQQVLRHRTAALRDSRLLPIQQHSGTVIEST